MKRFFGSGEREPSREELERQAAEELRQWTELSRGGEPSRHVTPGTPSRPPPTMPAYAGPGSSPMPPGVAADPEAEEEAITEFALMQLAERRGAGARLEDVVVQRPGRMSAEAMRDRALAEYLERKQSLERERRAMRAEPEPEDRAPSARNGGAAAARKTAGASGKPARSAGRKSTAKQGAARTPRATGPDVAAPRNATGSRPRAATARKATTARPRSASPGRATTDDATKRSPKPKPARAAADSRTPAPGRRAGARTDTTKKPGKSTRGTRRRG